MSTATVIAPAASPEEAAAIAAAIGQFMRDTAPVIVAADPPVNAWKQAALHEGVRRAPDLVSGPWGVA